MNIATIICMHGKLGLEILKTSELIIGKQKNIYAVEFLSKENIDTLINKYKYFLNKLNTKNGIIFFVDIWGGSPFNAANKMLTSMKNKCDIITGTNIPMLLEFLMAREEKNKKFEEIIKIALENGKIGINNINKKKNNNSSIKKNNFYNEKNIENKNSEKMILKLIRIDDRLIHGQVSTGWSKELKISKIIVINDKISKDKIRTQLLKQVSPPGITSHVVNIEKFIKVYNNPQYNKEKVLLLFTNPTDIIKIINKGVNIKSINIGGMSFKKDKQQITDSISVNKKDIKSFYKLHKMNIELEIRKVPNDKKINIIEILNKLNN